VSVDLTDPAVHQALLRAGVYDILAMGFAYPQAESLGRLLEESVLISAETATSAPAIAGPVEALASAVSAADVGALAGEHSRLFSGEVVCSPYETEYETDPFAKSRQLADISGFYHAFGMEVSHERRVMADFIGIETEFMSILCRKEAHAAMNGWDDKAALSSDAQRTFFESHLGRWFQVFCTELKVRTSADVYLKLADLLRGFLGMEMAFLGASPRVLSRRMVSASDSQRPDCDPRVVTPIPESD
jgi:DMSO reductase family type II enzyme chaperone